MQECDIGPIFLNEEFMIPVDIKWYATRKGHPCLNLLHIDALDAEFMALIKVVSK